MTLPAHTNAKKCARCTCCTVHLCACAYANRKACVDYALVTTTAQEDTVAACPCAPRGAEYPPPRSNVIPFPRKSEVTA